MVLLVMGCAPRSGWERTDRRTCAPAEPPRVCVVDAPDRQLVVRAGGAAVVPGECIAPARGRGGRLAVAATDGRSGATRSRWIRVRRGQVTSVGLGGAKDGLESTRAECPRE